MQTNQTENVPVSPNSSSRNTEADYPLTNKPLAESGFISSANDGISAVDSAAEYIKKLQARLGDSSDKYQNVSGLGTNYTSPTSNPAPYNYKTSDYISNYQVKAPSLSRDDLTSSTPALKALAENSSALMKLSTSPREALNKPSNPEVNVNKFPISDLGHNKDSKSLGPTQLGSLGIGEYNKPTFEPYTRPTFDINSLLGSTGISSKSGVVNQADSTNNSLKYPQYQNQNVPLDKNLISTGAPSNKSNYGLPSPGYQGTLHKQTKSSITGNQLYTPGDSGRKSYIPNANISVMTSPPLRRDLLESSQSLNEITTVHEPSISKRTLYTIENKGSISLRASRDLTDKIHSSKLSANIANNQVGLLKTPERPTKALSGTGSPLDELRHALKNDNVQISKIIIETVEAGGANTFQSPVKVNDLRDEKGNGAFDIVIEEDKLQDNVVSNNHNESLLHSRIENNPRSSFIQNSNTEIADKISGLGERLKSLDMLLSPGNTNAHMFDPLSSIHSKQSEVSKFQSSRKGSVHKEKESRVDTTDLKNLNKKKDTVEVEKQSNPLPTKPPIFISTPQKTKVQEPTPERKEPQTKVQEAAPERKEEPKTKIQETTPQRKEEPQTKSPSPIKTTITNVNTNIEEVHKDSGHLLPRLVFVGLVLLLLGVLSMELLLDIEEYEEKMDAIIL